ncbi:hypothetical protein EDB84DRAFT_1655064 [Lactarius hengduanensis]|nr:hypothetical protein EDB84DRAFT_1655064 [Lactarius hengduanensis]
MRAPPHRPHLPLARVHAKPTAAVSRNFAVTSTPPHPHLPPHHPSRPRPLATAVTLTSTSPRRRCFGTTTTPTSTQQLSGRLVMTATTTSTATVSTRRRRHLDSADSPPPTTIAPNSTPARHRNSRHNATPTRHRLDGANTHLGDVNWHPDPTSIGTRRRNAQQLCRHLKTAAPAPATSPPLKTPLSRHGRHRHLDIATPPLLDTPATPASTQHLSRPPRRGRLVTTPTTASTASSRPPPRRRRHLDSANSAPPQHNAIPTRHHLLDCTATNLGNINRHPDPTSTGTRQHHIPITRMTQLWQGCPNTRDDDDGQRGRATMTGDGGAITTGDDR